MFRILLLLIISVASYAQVLKPAKITASLSKTDLKVGDQVDVIFKVTIDDNWYVYTVGFDEECGPVPMKVTIVKNAGIELVGALKAIDDHKKHDEIFDCDVRIFDKKGEFRQTIKILSASAAIKGEYEGQVCTTLEGKCILFDGDFNIGFKVGGAETTTQQNEQQPDESVPTTLNPQPTTFFGPKLDPTILDGKPTLETESFATFLILAFILGFTALLTPCVFPMIPMTVTFFFARQSIPSRRHS
ncbi:MAG: protein-disulfide reductase DsbD domain-containing protein [Bacteroidota bacterium]